MPTGLRLYGLCMVLGGLIHWANRYTPIPRQIGPYEDPIGGGTEVMPMSEDDDYKCTQYDPEDCYES